MLKPPDKLSTPWAMKGDSVEYTIPDIETGHRYPVSKEVYESYLKAVELFKPKLDGNIGVPIVVGTSGEISERNIWFEDFSLGEKRPLLLESVPKWEEPPIYNYVMGVDSYGGFSSICVMRQHDNHIEYTNTYTDESEFEREVARLSEYYKCSPIGEGDYTTNTGKR